MKLRYALCGCNSKESAEIFRRQFLTFLDYLFILIIIFQVLVTLSTLIIMKPFSVSPKKYLNKTFYQTCFTDPEFTAESHRILHEKCIQLQNESKWVTHLPKDTITNTTGVLEPYEKLKTYLDAQQKNFNLTECFTELRENYIGLFESQEPYILMTLGSAILGSALFVLNTFLILIKSNNSNPEQDADILSETGSQCYILTIIAVGFSGIALFEMKYSVQYWIPQDLHYFVQMC